MPRLTYGFLLMAVFASACSSQAMPDEVGWTPVQEPASDPSSSDALSEPQSLGTHFFFAAARGAAPLGDDARSPEEIPVLPEVGESRITLASDACEVTLDSVAIELRPPGHARATLAPMRFVSVGPVVGRVLDASPHSLRVVFDATLQLVASPTEGSSLPSPEQAELMVEASEAHDGVTTAVRVGLGNGALSRFAGGAELKFTAWGEFTSDDAQVPARRWTCW